MRTARHTIVTDLRAGHEILDAIHPGVWLPVLAVEHEPTMAEPWLAIRVPSPTVPVLLVQPGEIVTARTRGD